ncbi:MAG: CHAT domain-containing protein, partial [Chitinophagaceae bacterium]
PNEFKDRLKSKANINWVLDERSAAYPWELLQEKSADAKPLCIGGGMIRQLMTNSFREDKQRGATELALIVGDPLLNGFAGQLDGARDEALKVQSLFAQHEFPTITLVNTNYHQVTNAMYGNDFKVMHLASHGVYDPADPSRSGMVVGDSVFLTTSDFRQLGVTPELVFINCCHLGRHVPPGSELATGRFRLAANIGTGLIESGVKAVIAAGWAVNDLAAHDFATVFYNKMFSGYNFGDAVSAARAYLYEKHPHNNTWGAYQCYGDPFYKLVNRTIAQKAVAPDYAIEEEALVDLNNLRNSLDTRSVTSVEALEKLELIMSSANNAGLKSASIAELRSAILLEVGEYQEALFAYNAMFAENAATFSVAALERLCNLRSKSCVAVYRTDGFSQFFINEMKDVFRQLDQLVTFGKTPERLSIIGSSYKRLALMSEAKDKLANYRKSEASYLEAYFLKAQPYSLNNWVVMKVILDLVDPSSSVPERLIKAEQTAVEKLERAYNNTEYREIEDKINQIRKTLSHHRKTLPELIEMISAARVSLRPSFGSMDYWDLIQEIAFDISLIFLGAIPSIPEMWDKIYGSFADIWKRAGSKGKMMSEVENLEILSDMLSLSVSERITDLKEDVDELKLKLELLVR